jgi:hypothetical protein
MEPERWRKIEDLFHAALECEGGERANNALYIGSLDSREVTGLMPAESAARYIPPSAGRPEALVYYKDGALVAQPFNLEKRRLAGDDSLEGCPITIETISGATSGADMSAVEPSKMPRNPPSRSPRTGFFIGLVSSSRSIKRLPEFH